MIVWLTSYPRSGNTLCRTMLNQCFGIGSFSDDPPEGYLATRERVGHIDTPLPFEDFYRRASVSEETFFVKTHQAPRDDQPAIYVVRDGRATVLSYHRFHAAFHPDLGQTLAGIVVGDDHYGDWTSHYRSWNGRSAGQRVLVLKYEELVHAPPAIVGKVAEYISFKGTVRPWVNPFEELRRRCPEFYREGRISWTPPPDWTPVIDGLFWHLHAPLMQELGYAGPASISGRGDWTALADLACKLLADRHEVFAVARDKDAEIARLKAAATEKDKEIQMLTQYATERLAAATEKDKEIQMLTQYATERLAVIQRLQASREYNVGLTILHPWQVLRQRLSPTLTTIRRSGPPPRRTGLGEP
jgi:hypothetical protein